MVNLYGKMTNFICVLLIHASYKPLHVFLSHAIIVSFYRTMCLFIQKHPFIFRLHPHSYVLILVRLACQCCVLREADGCVLVLRYLGIKDLLSTVQRRMRTLTRR